MKIIYIKRWRESLFSLLHVLLQFSANQIFLCKSDLAKYEEKFPSSVSAVTQSKSFVFSSKCHLGALPVENDMCY